MRAITPTIVKFLLGVTTNEKFILIPPVLIEFEFMNRFFYFLYKIKVLRFSNRIFLV